LHPLCPVTFVHGTKLVAAAAHPVRPHSLQLHADVETFLETTVGAALALRLVDVTAPIRDARVHFFVLHRPLEEALAAFAGEQPVVVAAVCVMGLVSQFAGRLGRQLWPQEDWRPHNLPHFVAANWTQLFNALLCVHHHEFVSKSH